MCWQKPSSWPWADVETPALSLAGHAKQRFWFSGASPVLLISLGQSMGVTAEQSMPEDSGKKGKQEELHRLVLQTPCQGRESLNRAPQL